MRQFERFHDGNAASRTLGAGGAHLRLIYCLWQCDRIANFFWKRRDLLLQLCLYAAFNWYGAARILAECAHKALAHGQNKCGWQQKRINAHIYKTRNNSHCIICVKRGEYKMPRESRVNCELRGFFVADLAYHDDVGVLAQNTPQA